MSLAALIFGLIRYGPNLLLYPGAFEPHPRVLYRPSQFGLPYEDIKLTTTDKIVLQAYLITQPDSSLVKQRSQDSGLMTTEPNRAPEIDCHPTVIMFHGNGDNIGFTIPLAKEFYDLTKCHVLMVSPRGYGLSEGRPSTKGFKRDSEAALNYVHSHPQLSNGPIILYGQSMGGAFAIDLACAQCDKIDGVIVENTFTSLRRLIPEAAPVFSFFAPLLRQWNSLDRISRIPLDIPMLMLSGQRDNVVPPAHMRRLWNIANPNEHTDGPKRRGKFVELPEGGHNDSWDQPGYWDAIAYFIEDLRIAARS